ncbi:hypothetical protein BU16DRAFT_460908 [Lophium mytilinum]|uniref:ASST-domain-containing protein n=1 Tax=Lophium mytilinum TaxID=390894 RepID=A0A6A6QSN2_9PEZI|nr:hypothetical protein BU16DRAFT_460908 [Lophium mytilinum]
MFSRLHLLPNSILLSFLLQNIAHVLADLSPYFSDKKFDNGEYGSYPMQTFHSSDIVAPRINILSSSSRCDDGSYILITPRGHRVPDEARGPMILDHRGDLVWAVTGYEQTYDLMVQEYAGQQYLTFWGGNDAIGGHGAGHYYMIDSTYKQTSKVGAASGMAADLHEFRFTDEGTALITVYDVHQVDLTSVGKSKDGYVWDSVVQEINIYNGELLFQWRASDHYNVVDSFHDVGDEGAQDTPWDFFHINSIEKDPWGNYLVSSRYMHTITYINGTSGSIIWRLGGKRNDFKDLSNGRATDFTFQHDARWHHNYTVISLFDNGAQYPSHDENAPYSRGMKIAIDDEKMTARLVTEYINPEKLLSSSQGSTQVLPNGNVLVGYGYNGAFTEYAANGDTLCDAHFGSAKSFHTGEVQSYRAMKFNWTGRPNTRPSMAILDGSAYVSWNGATEVHQWVVDNCDYEDGEEESWRPVINAKKNGFETMIPLSKALGPYIRIAALDKAGRTISTTETVPFDGVRIFQSDVAPLLC